MRQLHTKMVKEDMTAEDTARVYDQAADGYLAYADGDPHRLFSFEGHHAYADRHVWSVLETKLRDLRASGATSIHILDAGCGPGTWLRRLVTRAHLHGFSTITARGFDVSQVQVRMARHNASDLTRLAGVNLTFDVADLEERLPEPDGSVDITLCLYSVLSHLPVTSLPRIATEIGRVTRGSFVTTVRSTGSPPTAFIESIEVARRFEQVLLFSKGRIRRRDIGDNAFRFGKDVLPAEDGAALWAEFDVEMVRLYAIMD